jgi:ABC-type cobalt transport system substrate-binding protein
MQTKIKNPTRFHSAVVLVLGFLFLFPQLSFASDTLLSQSVDSSYRHMSNGDNFFQRLGTGLTGEIDSVLFELSVSSGATSAVYYVSMSRCDNSSYTVNCVSVWDGSLWNDGNVTIPTGGLATTTIGFSTSTPVVLDSSKYYKVGFAYASGTQRALNPLGSATSVYSSGICVNASNVALTGLDDCYFYVYGTQTVFDSSYVSSLSPVTGSTTASSLVNFRIGSHVVASQNVDQYSLQLVDNSVSGSFLLTGSVSSGDSVVSRNVGLASGHSYTALACLYSSSSLTSYGCISSVFSVVRPYDAISAVQFMSTSSVPSLILSPTTLSGLTFGVSTSTASSQCAVDFPVDSSDIIQATLSAIPNAICRLTYWLFSVSTQGAQFISSFPQQILTIPPFNLISRFYDALNAFDQR